MRLSAPGVDREGVQIQDVGMSKRFWIVLFALFFIAGGVAAAGAMGYVYVKHRRVLHAYENAERAFEAGEWEAAKMGYAYYLGSDSGNNAVLRKYAEASLRQTRDRDRALQDAAVAHYQIALNDPTDTEAIETLIGIHLRRRAWGDLEFFSKLFLEQRPDNESIEYHHALALDRMNRWEDAVEAYRELTQSETCRPEAFGNLAFLLHGRGLTAQAASVIDKAIEREPDDAGMYVERARLLLVNADVEGAERALAEARRIDPDHLQVTLLGARIAVAKNELDDALSLAEQAFVRASNDDEAILVLLTVYERRGEIEDAIWLIEDLDTFTRADNPVYYLALAQLMIMAGRIDEFEEVLSQYREVYPAHRTMFEYLEARALLAKGNASHAAAKLTTVVETQPDFRQAQYYLAVAHLQSQRRDRASSVLEFYLRNHPSDMEALRLFEEEFGGNHSPEETRKMARALLEQENPSVDSLISTVKLLARVANRAVRGDEARSTAVDLLKRAVELDRSNSDAYLMLLQLLAAQGDITSAEEYFAAALDAGVPQSKLRLGLAGIALADARHDEALGIFAEQMSEESMTVDDLVRWANFYASRGALDAAMSFLEPEVSQLGLEERLALRSNQIALSTRYGEVDLAVSILSDLEKGGDVPLDVETRRILNEHKEIIVRTLLTSGGPRDQDLALKLNEELERDEPESTKVQLLHISALLGQTPPGLSASRRIADSLERSDPNNPRVWMMMSELSAREGDLSLAHAHAERAVSLSPGSPEVQLFLGRLRMEMENFIEALPPLERALVLNPDETRAMDLLVSTYLETGRPAQAEATLERLEARATDAPEIASRVTGLRARLMLAKGVNRTQISTLLREKYEANPNDGNLLNDLAAVLSQLGKESDAEVLLNDFAERNSTSAPAWTALGSFYLAEHRLSDVEKASAALTRAIVAEPRFAPAMRAMIALQVKTDSWSDAQILSRRYLSLYPNDPSVLYQTTLLTSRLEGATLEAMSMITRAIALRQRPEYYYLRATLYLRESEYPQALSDLQSIERYQVNYQAALDLALAEAYLGVGEFNLARQYYKAAAGGSSSGLRVSAERLERLGKLLDQEESKA